MRDRGPWAAGFGRLLATWVVVTVVGSARPPTAACQDVADEKAGRWPSSTTSAAGGTGGSQEGAQGEPKTAAEFLARGERLYKQRDFDAAIDDISAAIRLEPAVASSYALRAQVWGARHIRDREIADLDIAVRLDPTNADYLVARGESWSSQGRHEQAMADYNEAIRLQPRNPQHYVARGNEWRRDLKLDLAVADYNAAIQLDPGYIHAYVCRAMITKQRRAFPQAVAELTDLARFAPEHAEVHRTLARILATCNNDEVRDGPRALREATRACELTQWRDPDCLDTLAAAYAEVGDYRSAVAWQTKALAMVRKEVTSPLQRAMNFGGRRGVGFEDRLAFYKRKQPTRE